MSTETEKSESNQALIYPVKVEQDDENYAQSVLYPVKRECTPNILEAKTEVTNLQSNAPPAQFCELVPVSDSSAATGQQAMKNSFTLPTQITTLQGLQGINGSITLPAGSKLTPDQVQKLIANSPNIVSGKPIVMKMLPAVAPKRPLKMSMEKLKHRKKRNLVIDEETEISGPQITYQLRNTAETMKEIEIAPPTKQTMIWRERCGPERVFSYPGRIMHSELLQEKFCKNLITTIADEDEPADEKDDIKDEFEPLKLDYDPVECGDRPCIRKPRTHKSNGPVLNVDGEFYHQKAAVNPVKPGNTGEIVKPYFKITPKTPKLS